MSSSVAGVTGGAPLAPWYAGPKSNPSTHVPSPAYAAASRGNEVVWVSRAAIVATDRPGGVVVSRVNHKTAPTSATNTTMRLKARRRARARLEWRGTDEAA